MSTEAEAIQARDAAAELRTVLFSLKGEIRDMERRYDGLIRLADIMTKTYPASYPGRETTSRPDLRMVPGSARRRSARRGQLRAVGG